MIGYELMPERNPLVVRRSRAGCAEGLDAWLGVEAHSGHAEGETSVRGAADWNAPQRVIALVYDTATQSYPSGVRAVLQEGSRRLLFEAQDYEMLVRVTPHRVADGHELIGQLLCGGLPSTGAAVRIEADERNTILLTDQSGGFRLAWLGGRACRLSVAVDGAVLVVPPMVLANTENKADSVGPGHASAS
jgi:hypothetical protein